jgi:hypothetical protein
MEQPLTAVYDANILYPAPVRDLFIRLAQAGLVPSGPKRSMRSGCATSSRTIRTFPPNAWRGPVP